MIEGMNLSIFCLVLALFATATGQMFFKMHFQHVGSVFLFLALGTFAIIPVCSYLALLNLSLAAVYMTMALTNVLVLVMSHFFLKERITKRHIVAVTFIVFGVLLFNV